MRDHERRVSRWAIPFLLTLFAFVLFRFVLFIGYVPTSSMEPTLQAGSYIIGSRFVGNLKSGDVIVFYHDGQLLVKRIAACPEERVDRHALTYMSSAPIPDWDDPILIVPKDCYFVLGDNSQNSLDSRYWDDPFVHRSEIIARIFIN